MKRRLRPVRLLAISGSLRAASSNTAILRAMAEPTPNGVEVILYRGLAGLPHFNPDLDDDGVPPAVADFRAQLRAADGASISSQEYAHGVPGAFKNGLDWVVASGEFVDKPVALINASDRRRVECGDRGVYARDRFTSGQRRRGISVAPIPKNPRRRRRS